MNEIHDRLKADMTGLPASARDIRDAIETARILERESIAVMLDRMAVAARRKIDATESRDGTISHADTIEGLAYVKAAAAVRARGRT